RAGRGSRGPRTRDRAPPPAAARRGRACPRQRGADGVPGLAAAVRERAVALAAPLRARRVAGAPRAPRPRGAGRARRRQRVHRGVTASGVALASISRMEPLRIGVLAVQGNFREHAAMLRRLGAEPVEVRLPEQLRGLDGLIVPGGESTTITRLMRLYGLDGALRGFEPPIFGTCAGMIVFD